MSSPVYDPDSWLESLTRALKAFCEDFLNDPDVTVENSFPDTSTWTKETPLAKAVVHFEIDDISTPTLGFGTPGVDVFDDLAGTVVRQEAQLHLVNFDVGVWVSAEMGGSSKRMELVRKLKDMFTSSTSKQVLRDEKNGIYVVSFEGGSNALDRINDLPLWRTMGMTLICQVFSRFTPPEPTFLVTDIEVDDEIVIIDQDTLKVIVTP